MFGIISEVGLPRFLKAGILELYRKFVRQLLFNSYSQDWEDLEIDNLLKNKRSGFYLEIGGYDPKRLSNTYRFYKKGWCGVVVEPNPNVREKFLKIRTRDKFLSLGLGNDKKLLEYYRYLIPALNTFSQKEVKENKKKGFEVDSVLKIKIIDVKSFLKKYVADKKIDFLSIDTEGWDYQILKNWDWEYRPKVICVEKDKNGKVKNLLTQKGYKLDKETRYNLIFKCV